MLPHNEYATTVATFIATQIIWYMYFHVLVCTSTLSRYGGDTIILECSSKQVLIFFNLLEQFKNCYIKSDPIKKNLYIGLNLISDNNKN